MTRTTGPGAMINWEVERTLGPLRMLRWVVVSYHAGRRPSAHAGRVAVVSKRRQRAAIIHRREGVEHDLRDETCFIPHGAVLGSL